MTFTVMTFNVGNGLAKPARLVAALRICDADVVGLQELNAEQAEAIERDLRGAPLQQSMTLKHSVSCRMTRPRRLNLRPRILRPRVQERPHRLI